MNKSEYAEYLQSDHWKNLKATKKKPKRCLACTLAKPLQLHHMIYRDLVEKTELKDLVWLCGDCHKLFHEIHGLLAPAEIRKNRGKLKAYTKFVLRGALVKMGKWPHAQGPNLKGSETRRWAAQTLDGIRP